MKRNGKLRAIFRRTDSLFGHRRLRSSTANTPAVVFVSVSLSTVTEFSGAMQNFMVTVIGTNNTAVTNGRVR